MFEMILMLSLFPAQSQSVAQVRPCVWPNTCRTQEAAPAPTAAVELVPMLAAAPITTCQWPNVCNAQSATTEPTVSTCQYPNKCS